MLRILVKNPFLNFEVAEDYYLYKKIKIFVNNKDVSKVNFPESKIKEDEFFWR